MSASLAHIRGMPRLLKQLHAYPRFIEAQGRVLLHKHARALISSSGKNKGLVQIVPPASMDRQVFGAKAKAQGETKVMDQVWKVYGTSGDVYKIIKANNKGYAAQYWAAIKRKDWPAANAIARRAGAPVLQDFLADDGAEHKRRRRNGQVTGKNKTLYVTDARYVRAYIRLKQRNVGLLAAALVNNYSGQFGPLSGVPAWIARHGSSWGSASIRDTTRRIRISLDGKALNSTMQRFFNTALRFRIRVMEREAPHALRAAAKSAGLLH